MAIPSLPPRLLPLLPLTHPRTLKPVAVIAAMVAAAGRPRVLVLQVVRVQQQQTRTGGIL
jgi:hypothetical protein